MSLKEKKILFQLYTTETSLCVIALIKIYPWLADFSFPISLAASISRIWYHIVVFIEDPIIWAFFSTPNILMFKKHRQGVEHSNVPKNHFIAKICHDLPHNFAKT